jgi:hypothetical protein
MNTRAARRNVRTIPSLVMALAALLLGACVHYVPDQREAVASPVPTSSAGCGLQELPASWQAALKPTTLTSSNDLVLAMRDATTGRTLYVGARSTVILTAPGAEPRVVFQFLAPEQVWRAMIDGDWIVVLTFDDVGVTRAHVRRVDGVPFLLPLREGDDHMASPFALVRNGTLFVSVIPDPSTKAEVEIAVNLATGAHTDLMVPHSTCLVPEVERHRDPCGEHQRQPGKITAIREDTLAQVEVPAVLAGLGDAVSVASDGATAAWSPPTSPGLTVARQGWSIGAELPAARRPGRADQRLGSLPSGAVRAAFLGPRRRDRPVRTADCSRRLRDHQWGQLATAELAMRRATPKCCVSWTWRRFRRCPPARADRTYQNPSWALLDT